MQVTGQLHPLAALSHPNKLLVSISLDVGRFEFRSGRGGETNITIAYRELNSDLPVCCFVAVFTEIHRLKEFVCVCVLCRGGSRK